MYVHFLWCTASAQLSTDSLFSWQINCATDAETLGEASSVLAGLFMQVQFCAVVDTLASLGARWPSQGGYEGPQTPPACSSMGRTTCKPNQAQYGSNRSTWMHVGDASGAVVSGLLPDWVVWHELASQLGSSPWQKLINPQRAVQLDAEELK